MKQDKRLLLSLALTVGILFVWTVLFPAPPPKPPASASNQAPEKALAPTDGAPNQAKLAPAATEPIQMFRLGEGTFGMGEVYGGVRNLTVQSNRLLVNADPGLLVLQMRLPEALSVELTTEEAPQTLRSEDRNVAGFEVTRTLTPDKDPFFWDLAVNVRNASDIPQSTQLRLLVYHPLAAPTPDDRHYAQGFVSIDGKVQTIKSRPGEGTRYTGAPSWITAQGRSTTIIVQPAKPIGLFHVEQSPGGTPLGWLELPAQNLSPGAENQWRFRVYAGPLLLPVLREAGLEEAFSMGFFSGIAKLLLGILLWGETWLGSYGLSIILLSVLIWLVFFPVTWSGIRMMKVMSQIQPQLAKIQKEHKNNPQKLNQEMMAIYKKNRVNPMSGCLPMLLQMPIFLALYQVLQRSPQLQGASFGPIRDLSSADRIIRFQGPLPVIGDSINVLPIVMAVAMFFQQKMTTASQTAMTDEQKAQQQVFKFMPILFAFLFYSLPSGLVLYWVTNTMLTLAQYTAFHRTYKPAE